MLDILLPFGLLILVGAAYRRFSVGSAGADSIRQGINVFVLDLCLPALCVKIILSSAIGIEAVLVPATAMITTLACLLAAFLLYSAAGRLFRLEQREKGVLILAAAFGNVTYLGLPVLTGLYGQEAAKYALFYDLLATTPLVWTLGVAVASRYGMGGAFGIGDSVRSVLSLPPIWGIGAGFLLKTLGITLPAAVMTVLGMLGGLVVPLMIFSIGLALTFPRVSHAYAAIPVLVMKLVLSPLLALVVARHLGLTGTALSSCVIEGAMPTMAILLLVAAKFGLDTSLAAFVIVVTTLASFFTLPLVLSLVGAAAGP